MDSAELASIIMDSFSEVYLSTIRSHFFTLTSHNLKQRIYNKLTTVEIFEALELWVKESPGPQAPQIFHYNGQ